MLQAIDVGPSDPILNMLAQFHADPNPEKIDLGIGVYRDSSGQTPILNAVKRAEKWLLKHETSKAYLGPAGDRLYCAHLNQLLFGDSFDGGKQRSLQTPGGTGALRVAGDILQRARPGTHIWLSNPPWVTHRPIFSAAGLHLQYYRYFSAETHALDFPGMMEDLQDAEAGDVVLIQVAGHNPTGCDLDISQWETLSAFLLERGLTPILDLAYHGLCTGLDSDLVGLRIIQRDHPEWLLCYSASKTFGIYFERTGMLTIHTAKSENSDRVYREALNLICGNYYMPPGHGASVVRTILKSEELTALWQSELESARSRISDCRKLLADNLNASSAWQYRYLNQQRGMFSYLGLNEKQLKQLRKDYSLYVGTGGRINVAGVNTENIERICSALNRIQR